MLNLVTGEEPEPSGAASRASSELPLCVDLDGTLVRGDTLHEQALQVLMHEPLAVMALPRALLAGKAAFKRRLAAIRPIQPSTLSYQADLLEYLRAEKARGREIFLTTAADSSIAEAIAAHLGIFDGVIASDGAENLKGPAKARRLVARFGKGGFAYAGNDQADVAIWREAGEVILVNAPKALDDQVAAGGSVHRRFGAAAGRLRALVKALRLYQWVKNVLVFLPVLLAHAVLRADALVASVILFVAFGSVASATYVLNDVADLESDRAHPRKRRRPFASGDLPLSYAAIGPALMLFGLALAWAAISFATVLVLLIYVAATTSYSAYLKKKPLVDVFTLAGLYSLRVLAGAVATHLPLSVWLLGFSLFIFLSLAFLKRVSELGALRAEAAGDNARRGYRFPDYHLLQTMGVASAFTASMILALYLNSEPARALYAAPAWLWLIVPLQLFAQCRLWLASSRGTMTDDPIVYALKDRVCWIVFAGVALVFVLATVGPRFTWM